MFIVQHVSFRGRNEHIICTMLLFWITGIHRQTFLLIAIESVHSLMVMVCKIMIIIINVHLINVHCSEKQVKSVSRKQSFFENNNGRKSIKNSLRSLCSITHEQFHSFFFLSIFNLNLLCYVVRVEIVSELFFYK